MNLSNVNTQAYWKQVIKINMINPDTTLKALLQTMCVVLCTKCPNVQTCPSDQGINSPYG